MIHLRKIVESLFDENTCIHCGNLVDENLDNGLMING